MRSLLAAVLLSCGASPAAEPSTPTAAPATVTPTQTERTGTGEAPGQKPQAARSWRQRVIYLVMPDRFFNGDPSNDAAGNAGCFDRSDAWRFHGGDWAGLEQKLPYLSELGVDAVWITPAAKQQGCGYHGYWADLALPDERAVEPKLGTSAELKRLADSLHARDMKLILDLVVNHSGRGARLVSQKPGWFHASSGCAGLGDPTVYCPLAGLPDFAQELPEVAAYLDASSAAWVAAYGVDGVRMDTAKHVPRSYFRDRWHPAVRGAAPGLFTVAEVFIESRAADLKPFLDEAGFDSVFDFPRRRAMVNAFARGGSVDEVATAVADDLSTLGLQRTLSLTAFLSNHDVPRFTSLPGAGVAADEIRRRYFLALTALFTLPGIPQLYAGEELGVFGGGDPDNRRDLPAWAFTREGRSAPHAAEALPSQAVFERVQTLVSLRRTEPALADGEYKELWRQNGGANVFAWARNAGRSHVIAAVNNGTAAASVDVRAPTWFDPARRYEDALGEGATLAPAADGRLRLTLPAKSSAVFFGR